MERTQAPPEIPEKPEEEVDLDSDEFLELLSRSFAQFEDGTAVTHHKDLEVDGEPFFAHCRGGKPASKDEVTTIRCDASFKKEPGHGKVGAVAWQITTPEREYKAKKKSMRRFPGNSAMTEVYAAIHGMKEARDRGARHVLIKTDNQNVAHYLADTWYTDSDSYAREPRNLLEAMTWHFDSVQVQWVRTKSGLRDVDRLARKAMKAEFRRLDDGWNVYVDRLQNVMEKDVSRVERGARVLYDGFEATADPPRCPCRYFKFNTAPALARNPKAKLKTVCKHLAAAFVDAGCSAEDMARFLRDFHLAKKRGDATPALAD